MPGYEPIGVFGPVSSCTAGGTIAVTILAGARLGRYNLSRGAHHDHERKISYARTFLS
jgi:hypothetical protein